jgi:tRNA(fMet)-specific endonuclease VapC
MTYLLDTNVCIKLLNNSSKSVVKKLSEQEPNKINLCSVVEFELFYGAYRSQKTTENINKLERLFSQFNVLPFDSKCARIAGLIRFQLNKKLLLLEFMIYKLLLLRSLTI